MNPVGTYNLPSFPIHREKEIIYQWNVNDCVVYLMKKQDALGNPFLEYKTMNKDKEEIYTGCIEIPASESIEETISYIKTCKAIVDENGIANFLQNFHTWKNANRDSALEPQESLPFEGRFVNCFSNYHKWKYDPTVRVSLTLGIEGLVWNVFQRITKECSFHHFQEATIPSLRCHPETIALIEKIKKEGLSNPSLLYRLISDFKVRVISPNNLLKEHEALVTSYKELMLPELKKSEAVDLTSILGVGPAAVYAAKSVIGAGATAVKDFFGGGVFGSLAAGTTVVYTGALTFSCSAIAALTIGGYFFTKISIESYLEKTALFEKKKELLSPQIHKPLLIEIEPISLPSVIDERVRVSKFTWAVTLVTHTGSEGNHARIIIEGINDGFYDEEAPQIGTAKKVEIGEKFIHLADYSPQIQSGLFSPDALEYETRTEIWMRSSDKVKKMLEAIKKEQYFPAYRRPFNFYGKNSKFYQFTPWGKKWRIFSGKVGDNCFTWARDKLKMINIDLGEGYTDLVVAMAKNYTRDKEEYKTLPIQEMI
ncbi:hypothetical protein [Candidatus Rhabdochlamydia sp. T3358]|uniref:hypothetical protein n=1 Tax=Candidatus Rhabdochlamydia sp. T3358 TaxID=2099795 RepID=UPI0010B7AD56|nr:hypothetical protein [Candidatus Rhabdochlamydia sp. T3358]VHO03601.1 hypothetical protein RHT_00965 [Candidatus Rhabdochlamydia sp. T3358]